ncbi:MAG: cystathionine beta-lyase [Flavobacteriaceae bacterium]|nr:cystathionine beta-lyase [Flavobacteriaceae bacterium]
MSENSHINTRSVHAGELKDDTFKSAVSPLYPSTSYAWDQVEIKRYPRYFNTPNQEALNKKIAALEMAEDALIFTSGMAAISTVLMSFLAKGDHAIFQREIYGGTYHFITTQLNRYGIAYDFVEGNNIEDFQAKIQNNTKFIYIESPSNPLMRLTDIKAIADLCKSNKLISMIDNTFASPVNQNPITLGIDLVIHSATKYMGGHSDISAGAVAGSTSLIKKIWDAAICYGGNLSDYTVWLLERSIKTMGLRVKEQSYNAMRLALHLQKHSEITQVHYPGLGSHPDHNLALSQMNDFGGMLSFEIRQEDKALDFIRHLKLIKPSLSLAGIESTILLPSVASHALMPREERLAQGIKDGLLRLSVGIEDFNDLTADIDQALLQL